MDIFSLLLHGGGGTGSLEDVAGDLLFPLMTVFFILVIGGVLIYFNYRDYGTEYWRKDTSPEDPEIPNAPLRPGGA